jgi:hypothetical protein
METARREAGIREIGEIRRFATGRQLTCCGNDRAERLSLYAANKQLAHTAQY